MSGLAQALEHVQAQFDEFKPGTTAQPAPGTRDWFLLRATALGLSYLRQVEKLEVGERPEACERIYKKLSSDTKRDVRTQSKTPLASAAMTPAPSSNPSGEVGADVQGDLSQ